MKYNQQNNQKMKFTREIRIKIQNLLNIKKKTNINSN
jgi:hypothetical protein